MADQTQPVPRIHLLGAAIGGGIVMAIAAQSALETYGLDLGALWGAKGAPEASELRAAAAWWLIAGVALVSGFLAATAAKLLLERPKRFLALRWLGGLAALCGLAVLGRQAAAPTGLSPGASAFIGVAVLCVAAALSLLGAFFVARR